jgi:hypothetical protein
VTMAQDLDQDMAQDLDQAQDLDHILNARTTMD